MIMFSRQFDNRPRVYQAPGSSIKQLYKPVIHQDGSFDLLESGSTDLYAEIQSHKDSVDIHVLLQRFAEGDKSALSRVQAVYGDFTEIPTTYAELLNSVIQGEAYFASLPLETRAAFNHDFRQWMAGMDDMPGWLSRMGIQVSSGNSVSPSASDSAQASPSAGSSSSGGEDK